MGLVALHSVTRQFGGRVVLDDVTVELSTGETVGIVGPNGAGKSTMFRLILGELTPDMGAVRRSRGLEIGHLPQDPQLDPNRSLHDEVLSAYAPVLALEQRMHELSERMTHAAPGDDLDALMREYDRVNAEFLAAGGYTIEQRVKEVLCGVGFAERDFTLPTAALSGGQRCRTALAKLLLEPDAYLLLDEPTNHLDMTAVAWLERFLASRPGGAAIVSHDRYLLDRVAQRIVEVDRGKIRSYPGNYSNYVQSRERNRLTQVRQFEKDREFIAKEKDFIARHMAGQRSKEARGRRTRLERQLADGELTLERPVERRKFEFDFDADVDEGRVVIEAIGLSKSYGPRTLFSGVSLKLGSKHRMGIIGPNGVGKSTLLKIITGALTPDAGTVRIDGRARTAYFTQDASDLDPEQTVLGSVLAVRPDLDEARARSLLGHFLFSGEDVFKPAGRLSGGEQSRVRLVRMILSHPNVLILDEPTNHLDIRAREALEDALSDFPGAILAVSHDRYFLDRIADRIFEMQPESCRLIQGNYSDYSRVAEAEASERARAAREERARPGEPRAQRPAEKRSKRKLAEIEDELARVSKEIDAIHEQFADPGVYKDGPRMAALRAELDRCQARSAELESLWFEAAE